MEALHENRFLGNDAIHEIQTISKKELKVAIEILENTLDMIYGISEKKQKLKVKRDERKTNGLKKIK